MARRSYPLLHSVTIAILSLSPIFTGYSCSSFVSTLLRCPDITLPVTTLSWAPHGQFLAVGSPGHSPLLIWDVSLKIYTPIKVRDFPKLYH